MKKHVALAALFLTVTVMFFSGCDEEGNPITPTAKVGFILSSTPSGAKVIINNVATSYFTPVTIDTLKANTTYNFALVVPNYDTLKFSATTRTGIDTLNKTLSAALLSYGPIRIYEYYGTTSAQPSGLSFKHGIAVPSSNKDSLDLYYYSDIGGNWEIRSANKLTGKPRTTWFKAGSSGVLTDGADSPLKDASWFNTTLHRDSTKYVFVYDQDGYYSKMKITNYGGTGTTTNPAWVEIKWFYNKVMGNTQF